MTEQIPLLRNPDTPFVDRLRILCGYIENGTDTRVKYFQDDATKTWCVEVGNIPVTARAYYADNLEDAFERAFQDPKNDPFN